MRPSPMQSMQATADRRRALRERVQCALAGYEAPVTATRIVQNTGDERERVVDTLCRMRSDGLVHKHDGCVAVWELTEKGRQ